MRLAPILVVGMWGVAGCGGTVVDGDFPVDDQHNRITYPLDLSSGSHEITAESDSGATLRETFVVPRGTTRYAVVDHWTVDGAAELSWDLQRKPILFG